MENLAAAATQTMSLYYTKQSRANVLSHLRQLSIFCVAFHETFLPVSRLALLGFIELMSRTCKFDHIEHIISSVKFLHDFSGYPFVGDAFEFKILQRGLKRKLAKPARQVLPITPEIEFTTKSPMTQSPVTKAPMTKSTSNIIPHDKIPQRQNSP